MKNGIILCAVFITGLVIGQVVTKFNNQDCGKDYSFVNTSVVCGESQVIKKTSYNIFYRQLEKYIGEKKQSNDLSEIGVYFRDLENGPLFGFNELAEFVPASLLKLPLAMIFLNSAENEPELLTYKISYVGATTVSGQEVKPKESAKPNTSYTVEELLRLMLTYSDNASLEALQAFLENDPQRLKLYENGLQELGLIDPQTRSENTLTVRGYASLFRLLYNTSFLNAEMSEKTLMWLTESDYQVGLKAGVPKDIKIAHKFGERFFEGSSIKQLHDCGIVYYPDNPYLLCIMTRGKDFDELSDIIKKISRMVYEEVDSRRL